jgi:hypothetical protein
MQRKLARDLLLAVNRAPNQGNAGLPVWLEVLPNRAGAGWTVRFRTEAALFEWLGQWIALQQPALLAEPED